MISPFMVIANIFLLNITGDDNYFHVCAAMVHTYVRIIIHFIIWLQLRPIYYNKNHLLIGEAV